MCAETARNPGADDTGTAGAAAYTAMKVAGKAERSVKKEPTVPVNGEAEEPVEKAQTWASVKL